LIYGASGGVGTAAIQLAKHFGLKVTAVSNSSSKEYCLDLGADDFIAYDQMNVFSMPIKCDIFFQIYSKEGSYYKRAKKLINKNGTFVCLIPNPLFMFYRLFSKPNFAYLLVKSKREDLAFLAHLMAKKIINPFISQSLPLSHMDKAHRLIEEGHVKGKIVVQV
jgi:NADPH2:quinone reductase